MQQIIRELNKVHKAAEMPAHAGDAPRLGITINSEALFQPAHNSTLLNDVEESMQSE